MKLKNIVYCPKCRAIAGTSESLQDKLEKDDFYCENCGHIGHYAEISEDNLNSVTITCDGKIIDNIRICVKDDGSGDILMYKNGYTWLDHIPESESENNIEVIHIRNMDEFIKMINNIPQIIKEQYCEDLRELEAD